MLLCTMTVMSFHCTKRSTKVFVNSTKTFELIVIGMATRVRRHHNCGFGLLFHEGLVMMSTNTHWHLNFLFQKLSFQGNCMLF